MYILAGSCLWSINGIAKADQICTSSLNPLNNINEWYQVNCMNININISWSSKIYGSKKYTSLRRTQTASSDNIASAIYVLKDLVYGVIKCHGLRWYLTKLMIGHVLHRAIQLNKSFIIGFHRIKRRQLSARLHVSYYIEMHSHKSVRASYKYWKFHSHRLHVMHDLYITLPYILIGDVVNKTLFI